MPRTQTSGLDRVLDTLPTMRSVIIVLLAAGSLLAGTTSATLFAQTMNTLDAGTAARVDDTDIRLTTTIYAQAATLDSRMIDLRVFM